MKWRPIWMTVRFLCTKSVLPTVDFTWNQFRQFHYVKQIIYFGKFTDLGNLIGNTQISRFFCHSDFTWNHFWSFWSPKNCHFLQHWFHIKKVKCFCVSQCGNFISFLITQIIREFNFEDCRSAISAIFTNLKAMNCDF